MLIADMLVEVQVKHKKLFKVFISIEWADPRPWFHT